MKLTHLIFSASLIAFLVPFISRADVQDCSTEQMDMLKRFVQEKHPKTTDLFNKLINCPNLKTEVIAWKALYDSFEDNPSTKTSSDRPDVLNSVADSGDFQLTSAGDIEKHLQEKNPNWSESASDNLFLARAHFKNHNYTKAQESYDRYMQLKPDAYDVRLEMGSEFQSVNPAYALSNYNLLLTQPINAGQKQIAEAGLLRVDQARDLIPYSINTESDSEMYLNHEDVSRSTKHFNRRTAKAGFQTISTAIEASGHFLNSDDPLSEQKAGEINAEKIFVFNRHKSSISTRLGWFQGSKSQVTGRFQFNQFFDSGIGLVLSGESSPWAKEEPLPKELTDWSYKAGTAGFDYLSFLSYRFTYSTITDQGQEKNHRFSVKYPILYPSKSDDKISLRFSGENYSTDRPSDYYDSPKHAEIYSAGLSYEKFSPSGFIFSVEAGYATNTVTPHKIDDIEVETIESVTGHTASFAGAIGANISPALSFFAGVDYSENRDSSENLVYFTNSASLTVKWDFEPTQIPTEDIR